MVTKRATDLRIVGGDPALELANTLEGGTGSTETLLDFGELVAWARKVGVVDRDLDPAGGDEALAAARRLRTATFEVFTAIARDAEPPPAEVAHLVAAAAEATAHARLEDGVLAWDGDAAMRAVWPFAVSALDLLRFGPLDRLKTCAVCPWLFIDTSRNHSRRWCSMDECGVRDKMQRYRERRATGGR